MARYRKKPVEVEAMRLVGGGAGVVAAWCGGRVSPPGGELVLIDTLEGTMMASPGDYVIRGVQGEFYPCKPDIFDATYEPVT